MFHLCSVDGIVSPMDWAGPPLRDLDLACSRPLKSQEQVDWRKVETSEVS
jgi:hypothetical protein